MKRLRQYIRGFIIEIRKEDFVNTYDTARKAHSGYYRRSGEEYFEHPKAVRNIVQKYYPQDYAAQLVAILHDTLEDFDKGSGFSSIEEIQTQILSDIESESLKNYVLRTVEILTRDPSVPYENYLKIIRKHPTAIRVKLADIEHNLTTNPSESQIQKYFKAIDPILMASDNFAFVDQQQINKLRELRTTLYP